MQSCPSPPSHRGLRARAARHSALIVCGVPALRLLRSSLGPPATSGPRRPSRWWRLRRSRSQPRARRPRRAPSRPRRRSHRRRRSSRRRRRPRRRRAACSASPWASGSPAHGATASKWAAWAPRPRATSAARRSRAGATALPAESATFSSASSAARAGGLRSAWPRPPMVEATPARPRPRRPPWSSTSSASAGSGGARSCPRPSACRRRSSAGPWPAGAETARSSRAACGWSCGRTCRPAAPATPRGVRPWPVRWTPPAARAAAPQAARRGPAASSASPTRAAWAPQCYLDFAASLGGDPGAEHCLRLLVQSLSPLRRLRATQM
mmetsp:Transcript_90722/g.282183  ORF Transcript_90722/g.282183 Transcript_90722/m.282183 type:complete len:324 (+) Transcript_90722:426-1397(+)